MTRDLAALASMHLTLKKEATRPPGFNSQQQQDRFDAFVREFNTERPHEALDMKCPAERYLASTRHYDGLPELTYLFRVTTSVLQTGATQH
jgi:transposase InsO family protein